MSSVQAARIPTPVVNFGDIDSTNAEAMRRIIGGARGPLWIAAERQVSGRGRSGRAWTSEAGNHYASLLLAPGCATAAAHQLSLVAGVAVFDAVQAVAAEAGAAPDGLRLKWPNDVLIGAAKLAGILVESQACGDGALMAVIGAGINLAHAPADAGRGATCLLAHGIDVTPARMLGALDRALSGWLECWRSGHGFDAVRSAWLARGMAPGTQISVHAAHGLASGTFAGLDADGALRLKGPDGLLTRVTFGDVTIDTGRAANLGSD